MAACAPSPSPLYVSNKVSGTIGEIPRDTRGEPIWSHIRQPLQAPPPSAFSTAPSLPVIPPRQD